MAVSLNGDGTITGLSTLDSVTITGLTSLTTTDLTADTTTLVVDSANNRVGIGTSSPLGSLSVLGGGRLVTIGDSGTANTPAITARTTADTGYAFLNISTYRTKFFTEGSERMVINESGNVGIGTSSPTQGLDILDTTNYRQISISNHASTGTKRVSYMAKHYDAAEEPVNLIGMFSDASSTVVSIAGGLGATGDFNNATEIQFHTAANTTTTGNSERMRIDSSGNVGIGTSAAGYGDLTLLRQATTATNATLSLVSGTSGYSRLFFGDTQNAAGEYDGFIQYDQANRLMQFGTAQAERMRIDSSGNVGIGTSSPDALLTVNTIASFGAGAASAPSIAAKGDLDTGMYFPGANQVALSTAGYVRLNINSAGTMIASKYNGTAASPSESADWPTPILALRGYGDFGQESMLSFGYSNDAAYQTGNDVWGFRLNGVASATTSSSSTHLNLVGPGQFYLYSTGDAIFAPGNSERMRITSTGNVGIGTSSVTQKLDVNGGLQIYSTNKLYFFNTGYSIHAQNGLEFETADYMQFQTGGANERMRISNDGSVYFNSTARNGNTLQKIGLVFDGSIEWGMSIQTTSNTGSAMNFNNASGTQIGRISVSATTTGYVTSSDYRLKENITPMSGSIDRLKQLKPSTWAWTQDGSHGEGFLAHEAQEVVPEAVHGTKDAVDDEGNPVYQGIDQSKLVPLLTAALQEAITKIENLETRIQALENQ